MMVHRALRLVIALIGNKDEIKNARPQAVSTKKLKNEPVNLESMTAAIITLRLGCR